MAAFDSKAGSCFFPDLNFFDPFVHLTDMLTLIQFLWSLFCITIRYILKRNHIPFKLHNILFHDRAPIITATKGSGYTVPYLVDRKRGVFDVTDLEQEIARYVDRRYRLDLFPKRLNGLQLLLSRYIEHELEMVGFKVNDTCVNPETPSG